MRIGLLHPGEMGAAIGAELASAGHDVMWASEGRSRESAERAARGGLRDVGSAAEIARQAAVVLSICPPHAARDVVASLAGFGGVFVDANAVSPDTAREVGARLEAGGATFVDGSLIGAPPPGDRTRLLLAGDDATRVADLFAGTAVDAIVLDLGPGAASAVKMAYAAWTKGTIALLLAARDLARAEGVEPDLIAEWRRSLPDLPDRSDAAASAARSKGWRWVGEMEEIAATMAAAGLPAGFHEAAAAIYAGDRRANV
jgi:3-hydroxyisobutyrate dehydrogenase-like beta-hydroxyacid dehydrogenase